MGAFRIYLILCVVPSNISNLVLSIYWRHIMWDFHEKNSKWSYLLYHPITVILIVWVDARARYIRKPTFGGRALKWHFKWFFLPDVSFENVFHFQWQLRTNLISQIFWKIIIIVLLHVSFWAGRSIELTERQAIHLII